MNPKRAYNANRENSFSFITSLTTAECVDRLKEAAFKTVDQRLSVRTDGQRFVVETPGPVMRSRYGSDTSTVRLQGTLESTANGTRVSGHTDDTLTSRLNSSYIATLVFCFGVIFLGIVLAAGRVTICFIGAALVMLIWILVYRSNMRGKLADQRRDLQALVYQWLYRSPSTK